MDKQPTQSRRGRVVKAVIGLVVLIIVFEIGYFGYKFLFADTAQDVIRERSQVPNAVSDRTESDVGVLKLEPAYTIEEQKSVKYVVSGRVERIELDGDGYTVQLRKATGELLEEISFVVDQVNSLRDVDTVSDQSAELDVDTIQKDDVLQVDIYKFVQDVDNEIIQVTGLMRLK